MKITSFATDKAEGYGLVTDSGLHPAEPDFLIKYPSLRTVLDAGKLEALPDHCHRNAIPLAKVRWLPPIPNPSKILCVGLNYPKPYPVDGAAPQTDGIIIFGRHDDSLVGHANPLKLPRGEAALSYDFEGEIVAVIGTACRHVSEDQALLHVMGYACMNEGSVRGWQKHSIHAGKNFLASGAWGPWITTADEAGPFPLLHLTTRVNGTVRQEAKARDMIHPLPKLISYLSQITRLNPGDVIATGSPDGTGGSRTPPAYLKAGDIVEVEMSGLGTLRNRVHSD
jgi:2-keto-4-pentenoate hydratase/2-oxohepta-3-ene-1,7-dioic acid hydratase in catechol pathway